MGDVGQDSGFSIVLACTGRKNGKTTSSEEEHLGFAARLILDALDRRLSQCHKTETVRQIAIAWSDCILTRHVSHVTSILHDIICKKPDYPGLLKNSPAPPFW
jgi:hypothetical protein